MLRPTLILLASTAGLSAQVSLTLLANLDVSITATLGAAEYIGNNPSAVAWNGTDLFLGGFNNSGAVGSTAIIKVGNALGTPTYGVPFGVIATTPASRGYSGLDIEGAQLFAAHDFGAVSADGIAAYDLSGNVLWLKNGRGSSGLGYDPGFFGADIGLGWTSFGVDTRSLQDAVLGTDIYSSTTGMVMNPAGSAGSFWRDMDYEPATGDVWLRKSNKLIYGLRFTGNDVIAQVQVDATTADFVNGQNVAFAGQATDRVVFWNDRSSTVNGQLFSDVLRCTRAANGQDLVVDLGGFAAPAGAGYYDFSYDAGSGTLAVADFRNRAVYIFAVSVYLEYGSGCVGAGGITPALDATGDYRGNGVITYTASSLAPLSLGLFAFGDSQAGAPLPFPGNCPLNVTPLLFVGGAFVTGPGGVGSGIGAIQLPIPPGAGGVSVTAQVVLLENGSLNSLVTSNGVQAILP